MPPLHPCLTFLFHPSWMIRAASRRVFLSRRRGYTLTELVVAVAVGSVVSVGLGSLMIVSSRMQKSVMYQQLALTQAMKGIENMNREIRMATSPLTVINADGNGATQGNRVVFRRTNEAYGQRTLTLESTDGDPMTPADNRLVLDPDTTRTGDEVVLATNVAPLDAQGAFSYAGANSPLVVRMRIGDPPSGNSAASNASTGPGRQGVEISIAIAPRNDSTP